MEVGKEMGSGGHLIVSTIKNSKKVFVEPILFPNLLIEKTNVCFGFIYIFFFSPSSHQREYSFHLQGDAANA